MTLPWPDTFVSRPIRFIISRALLLHPRRFYRPRGGLSLQNATGNNAGRGQQPFKDRDLDSISANGALIRSQAAKQNEESKLMAQNQYM